MGFKEIILILQEIRESIQVKNSYNKKILSIKEASNYIGLSASQLYKLTSQRKIKFYKPNGKVIFFLKEELDEYILSKPMLSIQETTDMATDLLIKKLMQ